MSIRFQKHRTITRFYLLYLPCDGVSNLILAVLGQILRERSFIMQPQEMPQDLNARFEHYPVPCVEDKEEKKPHQSKSRMSRYLTCPRSYFFSYEMEIRPLRTPIELLIGSATHRGIAAHYLAKKNSDVVNMVQAVDEIWTPEIGGQTPEGTKELMAARNDSYNYVNLFLKNVDLDPVEIETDFEIPLVNPDNGDTLPCTLAGIVDLVDIPDDRPRPIEIKTRASKAPDTLVHMSLELTCYAYWIWRTNDLARLNEPGVVPVGYIHIIKTKSPYIQRQAGVRDIYDFVDLYNIAKTIYESISEGRFHKNHGMHCSWCDYLPICTRDHDLIKATFGKDAYQRLWEAEFI
jgi:CRISPR/Cas system-associated exonuclease Cas4 (RecB family)